MEEFKEAIEFKKKFLSENPQHKEEVEDLFQLMLAECEDECASTTHEIELFIGSCEDLLED
jgi:hypothetical protein